MKYFQLTINSDDDFDFVNKVRYAYNFRKFSIPTITKLVENARPITTCPGNEHYVERWNAICDHFLFDLSKWCDATSMIGCGANQYIKLMAIGIPDNFDDEEPVTSWIPVTESLPQPDLNNGDFGCFRQSEKVLFTNGKDKFAGYYQTWDDNEFPSKWILEGRDGYTIDNVTYWTKFPTT